MVLSRMGVVRQIKLGHQREAWDPAGLICCLCSDETCALIVFDCISGNDAVCKSTVHQSSCISDPNGENQVHTTDFRGSSTSHYRVTLNCLSAG